MKKISSKVHAYLDYGIGIALIAMPWIVGYSEITSATVVSVGAGMALMIYNVVTQHEGGMVPILSLPGHLQLDAAFGTILGLSPWIIDFHESVYLPHLICAILIAGLSFFTEPMTAEDRESLDE